MKKFLVLTTMIIGLAVIANAQSTRKVTQPDTSINGVGSIVTFSSMPSKLVAITGTVAKISGAVAGKFYLEATVDGQWNKLDSLTLVDQAVNTKTFPIARTTYLSYRINYVPTGTQTSRLTATYIRRTDE